MSNETPESQCSVLGVPKCVRLVFRVFLLDDGVWTLVSEPFETPEEASACAGRLATHYGHDVHYIVRLCLTLLH